MGAAFDLNAQPRTQTISGLQVAVTSLSSAHRVSYLSGVNINAWVPTDTMLCSDSQFGQVMQSYAIMLHVVVACSSFDFFRL